MRTSKEELIQRGILMPGEAAQASPFLSSSVLLEAASRSSTPRLNLPQLAASSHSTGRSTSSRDIIYNTKGIEQSKSAKLLCKATEHPFF